VAVWLHRERRVYASGMMRVSILLVGLLLAAVAYPEVFRWVDEDGVVHFSDRPHEGAETVALPKAQTFSAPVVKRPKPIKEEESESADQQGYSGLRITRPGQDEVLWNTGGVIDVQIDVEPELQPGHSIQLFLDNQVVSALSSGQTSGQLTDVFRGTHALRAEIHDAEGNGLFRSVAVSFTVQQTSVQNQNNPNVVP
jgi:hypothetical protein